MFERYTEKARRVIFFARYEASQFGAQAIEAEHILLGLLREDKQLTQKFFRNLDSTIKSIRKEIEARTPLREKVSASVDLPLSQSAKRVLTSAMNESDRLRHRHIGTEHLLLGILREEKSSAAEILRKHGIRLNQVREEVIRAEETEHEKAQSDDTQEAVAEKLFSLQSFSLLLDLLVSKGVVSEEEKRDILNAGQ